MSRESEEPESTETAPEPKARMLLPVVLAILLGASITVLVGSSIVFYKKFGAMSAELSEIKEADKSKASAIEELLGQIEDLSSQIHTLKEYSIARSTPVREKGKKETPSASCPPETPSPPAPEAATAAQKEDKPAVLPPPQANKPAATEPAPVPPPAKPKETPKESCDLMGKTPEQQTAILKRCVGAMDSPPPAPEKSGNTKGSRK